MRCAVNWLAKCSLQSLARSSPPARWRFHLCRASSGNSAGLRVVASAQGQRQDWNVQPISDRRPSAGELRFPMIDPQQLNAVIAGRLHGDPDTKHRSISVGSLGLDDVEGTEANVFEVHLPIVVLVAALDARAVDDVAS